jgi:DNA-binding MarR family transcriptional regulator
MPKELVASSGFLLARLGFGFKAKALARLDQLGFDPFDYSVLAILAEGDSKAQSTIASALGIDPARLVAILDGLETRGLVTRQRDPQDRRRHVVGITPGGEEQLLQLRSVAQDIETEFLAPLDAESRERLHGLLLELAAYHDPRCAFGPPPPGS